MRSGPISLNAHAAIEPFVALVLIAAPWIFGFSDVGAGTAVSIAVGVIMLVAGSMTQWRYSLVNLIPLRVHFMTDVLLGAVLIVSPFVFGFSDEGGAARFTIIAGVLELLTALSTRWEPEEAGRSARRGTPVGAAR
jgi:SPW repeat